MSISPFEVMADAVSLVQDEAEDILNEIPIEAQINLAVQWNMNARINPDDSKFAKVVKFGLNEKGNYEFALIDNPWATKGKAKQEKEEKTNTESEKELTEEQKSDTKATSKKPPKKETSLAGADNAVS